MLGELGQCVLKHFIRGQSDKVSLWRELQDISSKRTMKSSRRLVETVTIKFKEVNFPLQLRLKVSSLMTIKKLKPLDDGINQISTLERHWDFREHPVTQHVLNLPSWVECLCASNSAFFWKSNSWQIDGLQMEFFFTYGLVLSSAALGIHFTRGAWVA